MDSPIVIRLALANEMMEAYERYCMDENLYNAARMSQIFAKWKHLPKDENYLRSTGPADSPGKTDCSEAGLDSRPAPLKDR